MEHSIGPTEMPDIVKACGAITANVKEKMKAKRGGKKYRARHKKQVTERSNRLSRIARSTSSPRTALRAYQGHRTESEGRSTDLVDEMKLARDELQSQDEASEDDIEIITEHDATPAAWHRGGNDRIAQQLLLPATATPNVSPTALPTAQDVEAGGPRIAHLAHRRYHQTIQQFIETMEERVRQRKEAFGSALNGWIAQQVEEMSKKMERSGMRGVSEIFKQSLAEVIRKVDEHA